MDAWFGIKYEVGSIPIFPTAIAYMRSKGGEEDVLEYLGSYYFRWMWK